MSLNWTAEAQELRAIFADTRDASPPISLARLKNLGYTIPELELEELLERERERELRAPSTGYAAWHEQLQREAESRAAEAS